MPFLSPIDVRLHEGKVGGTLLADLGYHDDLTDIDIWVPEGFSCDFGSVPSLFTGLVPRIGKVAGAYILHDWLYRNCGKVMLSEYLDIKLSRTNADRIMLEAMDEHNMNWWRRNAAWMGVRIGGSAAWDKYCGKEIIPHEIDTDQNS